MTFIKEVRGLGLMIGVELTMDGTAIFKECFSRGLIINCTQGNVLRIMPALNVTRRQINKAIHILDGAMAAVVASRRKQYMKRDLITLLDYSSAEILSSD